MRIKLLKTDPIRGWIARHKELGVEHMFTIGVPDPLPRDVLTIFSAAVQAENDRCDNSYPPLEGDPALLNSIIQMENNFGVELDDGDLERLFVTMGASQALCSVFSLFADGSDILVNTPHWGTAINIITFAGLNTVPVRFFEGGKFIEENANIALTDKTQAVFFNIPSNPVGSVVPKQAIAAMVDWALSHDLQIIEDSPYKYLSHNLCGNPAASPINIGDEASQNTTLIGTFSKTIKPDIRVGFMRIAPKILDECQAFNQMRAAYYFRGLGAGVPRSMQAGVNAIISKDPKLEFLQPIVEGYAEKAGIMAGYLEGIGCTFPEKPDAGFFLFPKAPEGEGGEDFVLRMAKENSIGFIPGTSFGGQFKGFEWVADHFRASVGGGWTAEKIREVLGV